MGGTSSWRPSVVTLWWIGYDVGGDVGYVGCGAVVDLEMEVILVVMTIVVVTVDISHATITSGTAM